MRTVLLSVSLASLVLAGSVLPARALTVTRHTGDGVLVPGFNRLAAGEAFELPAGAAGTRYVVANETGASVRLLPVHAGQAIGTLPAGHQGMLESWARVALMEIGPEGFLVWQGAIADGGDLFPAVEADLALSPPVAVFATASVGETADLVLTVTNAGQSDLMLGSLGGQDALASPFSLAAGGDGCSHSVLPYQASCTVTVRFAPEAPGTFVDSFDIPSNDPLRPLVTAAVGAAAAAGDQVGTDFSAAGLGSGLPAGWTERWVTGSATYTVLDSLVFPGTADLHVWSDTGARRLVSFDAADAAGADVEQLMLFRDPVSEGSIHTDFRLYARAAGTAGTETAYFFTTNDHQRQVNLYKNVAGALVPLAGEREMIGFNSSDSWWVRLRTEGPQIRAKLWPYGSVEPRDWQLAVTDDSIVDAGWQGIGNYWVGDHVFHEYAVSRLPAPAVPVTGFGIASRPASVVNLDAETGDTEGWTDEYGQLQVNANPALARSGNAHFYGGGTDFRAFQRFELAASGIDRSHLERGVVVAFRAWQRVLAFGDDPGRIGLRILDAEGAELELAFSDWDERNTVYVPKAVIRTLPPEAAFVDILLEGRWLQGAATSTYFDDLEVSVAVH